jgi:hypothetical protein
LEVLVDSVDDREDEVVLDVVLENSGELEEEVVVESVLDKVEMLEVEDRILLDVVLVKVEELEASGEAAPAEPSRLEVVVLLVVLFGNATLERDEEVVVVSEELDDDEMEVELVVPPFELVLFVEAVELLLEISCPVIWLAVLRRAKLRISSNTGDASVVQ